MCVCDKERDEAVVRVQRERTSSHCFHKYLNPCIYICWLQVMYRKAMSYQEKIFGYDGVATAATVSKIAELLFNKNDVEQAESMHRSIVFYSE